MSKRDTCPLYYAPRDWRPFHEEQAWSPSFARWPRQSYTCRRGSWAPFCVSHVQHGLNGKQRQRSECSERAAHSTICDKDEGITVTKWRLRPTPEWIHCRETRAHTLTLSLFPYPLSFFPSLSPSFSLSSHLPKLRVSVFLSSCATTRVLLERTPHGVFAIFHISSPVHFTAGPYILLRENFLPFFRLFSLFAICSFSPPNVLLRAPYILLWGNFAPFFRIFFFARTYGANIIRGGEILSPTHTHTFLWLSGVLFGAYARPSLLSTSL